MEGNAKRPLGLRIDNIIKRQKGWGTESRRPLLTKDDGTRNLAATLLISLLVLLTTGCTQTAPSAAPTSDGAPTEVGAAGELTPTQPPPTTTPVPSPTATATPMPANTAIPEPTQPPTSSPPSATPAESAEAAPPPTTAANSSAESGSSPPVQVYETSITLPTTPFRDFLEERIDPVYNIPVFYFNRSAYEATPHEPAPVAYTGVVLENPYLRLTFLPELGGRLYSAVVKATGQEIFYHNPVVKPSRYGVLQPYEANWWLATGGMEWAYPTQEHGYRFGVAWDYDVAQDATGATITLSDTGPDRVGLEVAVTLPGDSAAFTVAPKLINNGPDTAPVQLWTNAALALSDGSMSVDTQFILPGDRITVHSRGESGWSVPGERETAAWPQVDETNLADYNQWTNYLGFFVPNSEAPFIAAYNPETNLGVVRLSQADPGSGKLFAFGQDFPDRSYTNNDSQYFEIWGGANAGFWPEDDIAVAVGDTLGWEERWWPLAQLDGLTWAADRVAIYLDTSQTPNALSALVSEPVQGTLQVFAGDTPLLTESFAADPATPLQWSLPQAEAPLRIQFIGQGNSTLLDYQAN